MAALREKKKLETRQRISTVATALFYLRGFEDVTVDEIAAAADVSKMTVFNYFARKEDLFFDRDEEMKELVTTTLAGAESKVAAIDALHQLAQRLNAEKHPFASLTATRVKFWEVVGASPSLSARARENSDEMTDVVAHALGGVKADAATRLAAGVLVLTWRAAYTEAMRILRSGGSEKKADAAFLSLIDRGFAAARQAL